MQTSLEAISAAAQPHSDNFSYALHRDSGVRPCPIFISVHRPRLPVLAFMECAAIRLLGKHLQIIPEVLLLIGKAL